MSSVTRTAGPPSSEVGTSSGPTTQPKARSTKGSRVNTTPAQGGSAGTQFLRRDEGRVAYEVSGEGPLVVCVPGMGELRSVYRYTVPALVANGFRVASMQASRVTMTQQRPLTLGRSSATSAGQRS
jgi:hypothetical protein